MKRQIFFKNVYHVKVPINNLLMAVINNKKNKHIKEIVKKYKPFIVISFLPSTNIINYINNGIEN